MHSTNNTVCTPTSCLPHCNPVHFKAAGGPLLRRAVVVAVLVNQVGSFVLYLVLTAGNLASLIGGDDYSPALYCALVGGTSAALLPALWIQELKEVQRASLAL